MKRFAMTAVLGIFAVMALVATVQRAGAADPIITDSRILTEERRLTILETKLSSLQREINLLEDHRAIERLQQAWGHYLSEGMASEAAALFSDRPDASIEFAQQGQYFGRARIEAFLKASGARLAQGELKETPVFQGVVHVSADGRSAKGRWRSLVMAGVHGQDGRWHEGPYENEYIKEDGVWRIARLHWFTTIASSYTEGWHKGVQAAAGPLADLPPDRPPSIVYNSFPNFFLPPYHYLNPVTGKPVAWDDPQKPLVSGGAR